MKRFPGMCRFPVLFLSALFFLASPCALSAQTIYELRTLSDDDWLEMSTGERMRALNISNNHAQNQTFLGRFNPYDNVYRRWGSDYYEMNDRYENYGFRGFERYDLLENRRMKWSYNRFGERLDKMTHFGSIWAEYMDDYGMSSSGGPGGYIVRGDLIDGVWVVQESTDDWAVSLVGSTSLRTTLTPLTMSTPRGYGMRADVQTKNYEAVIVNDGSEFNFIKRGAQLRRKFGALSVGATFAGQYRQNPRRQKGNDFRGTVDDRKGIPFIYLVRILDDSPWDGSGPVIFNVRLKVNGKYRDDIQPWVLIDDITRETDTALYGEMAAGKHSYYRQVYNKNYYGHNLYDVDYNIPKYVDYLFLNDVIRGNNIENVNKLYNTERALARYEVIDPRGEPVRVDGTKYALYWFDISRITEKVDRVEAEVTVANDYRVQTAEIYTNSPTGAHDALGANQGHYDPTFWRTMAVAKGNVRDESNLRNVRVAFGEEVGNMIYGVDAGFDYYGYKIRGEYVRNIHCFMSRSGVPGSGKPMKGHGDVTPLTGHRFSIRDHACYLTARKDWGRIGIAGEYFRMGAFYRPYFVRESLYKNLKGYHSLIADNDDYDQYPDEPTNPDDPTWDIDGVFPGNDLDRDGIPDTEKNRNGMPDAYEPFFMFDADPVEFTFGDDFNNNTIPDFREDDKKFDTPYDLDRQGRHVFIHLDLNEQVSVGAGTLRSRGIGVDNRTDDDYVKVTADYGIINLGNLYAEYRYEKIRDNITDPYRDERYEMVYSRAYKKYPFDYEREPTPDRLEYRNSRVNRLFVETKIRPVPSLTCENHVKYERNSQLGGYMYDRTFQPHNVLSTIALVSKASLTKRWGNWVVTSGIKFRMYKRDRADYVYPYDYYTMRIPIVQVKYLVSPDTRLSFGMQGFDRFEYRYRDFADPRNDYRQKNLVMQVENKSMYFGYIAWGAWGFKMEQVAFDDRLRKYESYKSTMFFVQLYLGYDW